MSKLPLSKQNVEHLDIPNLSINIWSYKKWKIVFLTCCFDSVLIGIRSECNRLSCEHEKHSPEFEVYYYKVNN